MKFEMRRLEQIRELLTRELSALIREELDVPTSTLVTLTEVLLSEDFLHANTRISVWPDSQRDSVFRELNQTTRELRGLLGKRLPNLHPLPTIKFELDQRISEAAEIEKLAEKVKNEDSGLVAK